MTVLKAEVDPAEVGIDPARLGRLDRHFMRYVDDGRLPGWMVVISREGQTAYVSMSGQRDIEAGRPVEAERWVGLIDHWQYEDPGWAGDPATEAFAATLRVVHCRHGVEQMRADLDEAARKYAIAGIVTPTPAVYQGIACILAGEPGNADAFSRKRPAWPSRPTPRRSWWARCANGRCWRWPATTGARPRLSPAKLAL